MQDAHGPRRPWLEPEPLPKQRSHAHKQPIAGLGADGVVGGDVAPADRAKVLRVARWLYAFLLARRELHRAAQTLK